MTDQVKLVLTEWVASLSQVFESMADTRPEIEWTVLDGPPEAGAEPLWWEQPFLVPAGATVWVSAPRSTWEYAGTFTLKAAGLDTIEATEARNTWMEILGQSLSAMGRTIGEALGREVNCDAGVERAPAIEIDEWVSVEMRIGDTKLAPLMVGLSPQLTEALAEPAPASHNEPAAKLRQPKGVHEPAMSSRTMDLLLDIDLPVSISFGTARIPLKDVVKLTTGSVVELDRLVGEPVEVLVNEVLVARGEVVVVEGNYGVRIQQIASPKERLRSIR